MNKKMDNDLKEIQANLKTDYYLQRYVDLLNNKNFRKVYSKETKEKILNYMYSYNLTSREMAKLTNINRQNIDKWNWGTRNKGTFDKKINNKGHKVVTKKPGIIVDYVKHGANGKRYTIDTKIKIAQAILVDGYTITEISEDIDICKGSIGNWVRDYQDGKFSVKNATQVTRKEILSAKIMIENIIKKEIDIEILRKQIANDKEEARKQWEKEKEEMDKIFTK